MNMKTRLDNIAKQLEGKIADTFVIVWYKEDGIKIYSCKDTNGNVNKKLYEKIRKCNAPEELGEALNGEKAHLITIRSPNIM